MQRGLVGDYLLPEPTGDWRRAREHEKCVRSVYIARNPLAWRGAGSGYQFLYYSTHFRPPSWDDPSCGGVWGVRRVTFEVKRRDRRRARSLLTMDTFAVGSEM